MINLTNTFFTFVEHHVEIDHFGHPDNPDVVTETDIITASGKQYIENERIEMRKCIDEYVSKGKLKITNK